LAQLRAASGFKTAYAFYHSNGGRRVFPFTYAYYAKIERGDGLPRAGWLALILRHMRVYGRPEHAALVREYLRALCENDAAFVELFDPLLDLPVEPAQQRALRSIRARTSRHLTPAQAYAAATAVEFAECLILLVNTKGALTVEKIAELIKRPPPRCAAALKELKRHGMIKEHPGRRYSNADASGHPTLPEDARSRELVRRVLGDMRESCVTAHENINAYRLDAYALESVAAQFKLAFDLAAGLSRWSEGEDSMTPIFVLEARALRLFDAA
jgi:predicted transcriptional regulator